jgi:hypothetical protein
MRPCEDNTFMHLTKEELDYLKAALNKHFDNVKKE